MNRIQKRFQELKRKDKKALIVYITSGDPNIEATYKLVMELERCGTDIVELGVPFSDPIADGPTIQAASERALKNGVNLKKIFRLVRRIRKKSQIPIALMTYYNPVYRYGIERFVRDARRFGVDGVIVPDLPPEEAGELISVSDRHDFNHIFLLSPTSSEERIRLVARSSSGFIYYVSLTGVTGARERLPLEVVSNVRKIKNITKKPVCVGFGISSAGQAKDIARIADGVIVGSAVIKIIEKNLKNRDLVKKVGMFVKKLTKAVKSDG